MRKLRKLSPVDAMYIDEAIDKLKQARMLLRRAGANNAADYVQRSLKSVGGARRHADRIMREESRRVLNDALTNEDEGNETSNDSDGVDSGDDDGAQPSHGGD